MKRTPPFADVLSEQQEQYRDLLLTARLTFRALANCTSVWNPQIDMGQRTPQVIIGEEPLDYRTIWKWC